MTFLRSWLYIKQRVYKILPFFNLIADYLYVYMKMTGNMTTSLSVTKLTEDHHPDRDDERARIEAAGGSVVNVWGVPRVNRILTLSRAIGDVYLKR